MAEKKYLSNTGLQTYDEKIKALIDQKDAATLKSAKDYADGLADNYEVAGAAATAKTEAIAYADGKDAAIAAAKKAGDDADAKAVAAQSAADAAKSAADAAQGDVDALKTTVGTLPADGGYESVVDMVTKKTAGIATDANLQVLEGKVTGVTEKVTTLVGEDANKSVRTIANEELTKQLIPENAAESLNTLEEIAQWIQSHPEDAAAINKKIADLETKVGTLPEGQATVVAYIASVAQAVEAEKTRAENVEGDLTTRLAAVEGKFGEGDDSVASQVAAGVTEAKNYTDTEVAKVDAKAAKNAGDIAALTTRVGNAESDIDALQANLAAEGATYVKIDNAAKAAKAAQDDVDALEVEVHGADGNGGLKASVAANASAIDGAKDRITALEGKVGDGFTEISTQEISALFATA